MRELEDAKLAGIDYPVSSLINLRQVGSHALPLSQALYILSCLLRPTALPQQPHLLSNRHKCRPCCAYLCITHAR